MRNFGATLIAAAIFIVSSGSVIPAHSADAFTNAWALYNQQKFPASAAAFEALIHTSPPSARLYYYAALADRASNQTGRARQLCQYIVTNFPSTPEAAYAQKLFPDLATAKAGTTAAVPDGLKGKSVNELMQTEAGRKALESMLSQTETNNSPAAGPSAKVSPMVAKSKGSKAGERVFTAGDIAREGANGIDQMYYPNCWFESSMSALAMLPRGQKLMADMVRYGPKEGSYVVRFPGDGAEYALNEEKLEKTGIHDKALWATLIECGQTLKFPEDNGAMLADGLGCLTGQRAETITPSSASEEELGRFIEGAIKSQNPIICGSGYNLSGLPRLVVASHAYTIIGFEPASGMVKIRNPHGANAERFSLKNDDAHQKFEQLDDGVFKIHLSLFKMYFAQVAKADI